jgi:histidine triad (HIT) family protein
MSADCLFCRIGRGEIPAREVYRDEEIVAIEDINPQAPVHLLVMPLAHYANIGVPAEAREDALVGHLFAVACRLGRERDGDGYRLVVNTGVDGGQTVDHVHVHVLAGRFMEWPPG